MDDFQITVVKRWLENSGLDIISTNHAGFEVTGLSLHCGENCVGLFP